MTKSMKRIHKVVIKRAPDNEHDPEYQGHYEILGDSQTEAYLGILAYAEVHIPGGMHTHECIQINDKRARWECICTGSAIVQRITSGGLWGIESDSDAAYLKEIEQEQLSELRDQLHAIGFSNRAISAAMRDLRREEN